MSYQGAQMRHFESICYIQLAEKIERSTGCIKNHHGENSPNSRAFSPSQSCAHTSTSADIAKFLFE